MHGAPAVSVILPFRNAEETLERALASILIQTWRDFEIIAVDDGSADGSAAVARRIAASDPRLCILSGSGRGLTAALREGVAVARGEFLARMDADDISMPERLERQFACMRSDTGLALCGTGVIMTGPGIGSGRRRYEAWLNSLATHESIVRELFVECPVAHPAFFMRHSAYDAAGGYRDTPWAEDYDLVMRLWRAGGRFCNIPERLLEWCNTPGRLSMRDPRYSDAAFRALKRHYLAETHLAGQRRFIQWGAGDVGKRWLREWTDLRPEAVVDIHPRKIGTHIHGVPVIPKTGIPPPGQVFIIAAVGARGAREEIRGVLVPAGHVEMRDFIFVA